MSARDGHGQRLSAVDASFLRLEDPEALMHVGFSAIFSLPAGVTRPTLSAVRARAASRLHLVPRCRQRLAHPPFGLGEPRWVDDARFDIDEHLAAFTTPDEPVAPESFAALRDRMLSEPLPRDRPLWHMLLVPRLQDGRVGLVGRVHHAMADGTTALRLATLLADRGTEQDVGALSAWSAQPAPGAGSWALDPLADGANLLGGALRDAVHAIRRPRRSVGETLGGGRRIAQALRDDVLPRAPRSPVNVAVGPARTLVGHRADAGALRIAADGGTLNDAGLAVLAGALRALMVRRGEPPRHPLKAMVPVSLRRAAHAAPGNRLSSAAVWLPLDLPSSAARLASVREQTAAIKRSRRHHATAALMNGLALMPRAPRDAAFRAAASPRAYNLLTSHVRGPRAVLEMLGARLDEIYPAVPIGHRHALAVGMLSYDGQLHFGLHADPDAIDGLHELPELLGAEVAALQAGHGLATITSLDARRELRTTVASAAQPPATRGRTPRRARQGGDEHA